MWSNRCRITFSLARLLSSDRTTNHGAHAVSLALNISSGARIVMPAPVGLEIHRREFPRLAAVVDAVLEPPALFLGADLEPVLQQNGVGLDHEVLKLGDDLQKTLGLLFRAETHDALDTGAVVPAAIEDRDFSRRREVRYITLKVHL